MYNDCIPVKLHIQASTKIVIASPDCLCDLSFNSGILYLSNILTYSLFKERINRGDTLKATIARLAVASPRLQLLSDL